MRQTLQQIFPCKDIRIQQPLINYLYNVPMLNMVEYLVCLYIALKQQNNIS